MSIAIPARASAVVIGGGVIGSSVAYHLAKLGWSDVVQLERNQFSCGTTWHAAGLVGTMRANESHARLCEYSMAVLSELEAETGQSTGFRQVGSLTIAHSAARFEELKRVAAMNNAFGVTRVDMVTPEEIKSLYPYLETGDLLGGSWVAQDGTASPVDVTQAFVKGARGRGALCIEGVRVTGITQANGRVTGVITDQGEIQADYVVNCGGLWGREIGRMAGVNVPLHACEHYYAHTEKLDDLPANLPVMRDHDKCAYYREDAGSLLIGAFEPNAVAWGQHGIPLDFAFEELEGHMDEQFMPVLEAAMYRVPMLQDVGWRSFFCGPESFTPDDQFHMGEAPELKNFYVACGLNSVGIQTSGGLGRALADWMDKGHAPMDLWGNDIRRMFPFQSTQKYIEERVTETLGLLYDNHYPYKQMETARNLRHSPLHEKLAGTQRLFRRSRGLGASELVCSRKASRLNTSTALASRTGSNTMPPSIRPRVKAWCCSIRVLSPSTWCRGVMPVVCCSASRVPMSMSHPARWCTPTGSMIVVVSRLTLPSRVSPRTSSGSSAALRRRSRICTG